MLSISSSCWCLSSDARLLTIRQTNGTNHVLSAFRGKIIFFSYFKCNTRITVLYLKYCPLSLSQCAVCFIFVYILFNTCVFNNSIIFSSFLRSLFIDLTSESSCHVLKHKLHPVATRLADCWRNYTDGPLGSQCLSKQLSFQISGSSTLIFEKLIKQFRKTLTNIVHSHTPPGYFLTGGLGLSHIYVKVLSTQLQREMSVICTQRSYKCHFAFFLCEVQNVKGSH